MSLADPAVRRSREGMLRERRMAPLVALVEALRARFGETPWPDPADGGAEARLLILLETPGPRVRSTGFVSLDNPTGTARNLSRFVMEARIDRRDLLLWNVVPWVIHTPGALNRAPTSAERAQGVALIPDLLERLPRLSAVVLAGRHAGQARAAVVAARPGCAVFDVAHPSPTYVCTSPSIGPGITSGLAQAVRVLAGCAA